MSHFWLIRGRVSATFISSKAAHKSILAIFVPHFAPSFSKLIARLYHLCHPDSLNSLTLTPQNARKTTFLLHFWQKSSTFVGNKVSETEIAPFVDPSNLPLVEKTISEPVQVASVNTQCLHGSPQPGLATSRHEMLNRTEQAMNENWTGTPFFVNCVGIESRHRSQDRPLTFKNTNSLTTLGSLRH